MATDKPPYRPATKEAVKKNWNAQERSIYRQPATSRKPDPGIVNVQSPDEVEGIIAAELIDGPVPVFKMRSTAVTLNDPLARTQTLIRAKTQHDLTPDEFLKLVESSDDYHLFLILYGKMNDSQKASHLSQYADREFRKQQEVLKQHHLNVAEEEKKKRHALAAMKVISDLHKKGKNGI